MMHILIIIYGCIIVFLLESIIIQKVVRFENGLFRVNDTDARYLVISLWVWEFANYSPTSNQQNQVLNIDKARYKKCQSKA